MQILRQPSLTETEFLGAAAAFWDSLTSVLQSAWLNLQRLEQRRKGDAFAFEMNMDKDRYGAMIVLDRWGKLVHAFGPHVQLRRDQEIIVEAPARIQTAENVLIRVNRLIDAAESYSPELIHACGMAFDTIRATFDQEREAAARMASLGPMLPEDYQQTRRIVLADMAAR